MPIAAVLMAVVGIVLLIACVNVGNLLLARGAAREREISVRLALGARRSRIVRQLLTESLMLAAGGGLLGLVLGVWTGRLSRSRSCPPRRSARRCALDFTPDARVMACGALLALLTTLIFGLAPAWRASRTRRVAGAQGETRDGAVFGLRRLSLVAQVSLSLVLLLTAGLFLRVLFSVPSRPTPVSP